MIMAFLLIAGSHQGLCKFEQNSVCSEHSWQYRRRDYFNYLRAEQLVHPLDRLLLSVIPGMAMEGAAGHAVTLDLQAVVFRCLPGSDVCLHGFEYVHCDLLLSL